MKKVLFYVDLLLDRLSNMKKFELKALKIVKELKLLKEKV